MPVGVTVVGATGGTAPGGGGDGGGGATSGGNDATGGATGGNGGSIPTDLLDPARTTTWNPGILADGQLDDPLGPDGLPVRTTVCANLTPGDDINAAIADCPEGQVVELAAGTYTVSSRITLTKGVVLRGAGSAAGGTVLVKTGGGSVLAIGTEQDQACYDSNYGTAYPLTEDAVKESTTVHVGANAEQFAPGDLALLDEVDDEEVEQGDCLYFKRLEGRSVSQRVEVASVDDVAGP